MKENIIPKKKEFTRIDFNSFLLLISTISLSAIAINLVPISNSASFRNACIVSAKKSLKYKNPDTEEYGIDLNDLASIEGYRFCIQPR